MRKPKKSKRTASRKDLYTAAGILAFAGSLIFRILLQYVIGEKGIGFFSAANEIYFLAGSVLAWGLSEAVAINVRFRIRREQFKNADKVLKSALLLGAVTGGIISLVIFVTGDIFARKAVGIPFAGFSIILAAPCVIFLMMTGAFKGYFRGSGTSIPAVHSYIFEILALTVGGLMGAGFLYDYGEKVSALRQNGDYAAAYGAMGASIGILAASVLCFLHMLALFAAYHRNVKKQLIRDVQKNQDSMPRIIFTLLGSWMPCVLNKALICAVPLLDLCLFVHLSGETENAVSVWGGYYGRYLVFAGILCALFSLPGTEPIRRIAYLAEREDHKAARDKLELLIQELSLLCVPSAVFLAVFAENLLNLFFKGNNSNTASYMLWSGVSVVFCTFSGMFSELLVRMRRMNIVMIYEAAGLFVHIVMTILLLRGTKLSVTAVIVGNIIFYAVLAASGFIIVSRLLRSRQEWIRPVVFIIIDAALAGLVSMLLNMGISSFAGTTIALVVSLLAGIAIYMVLLVATRAVNRQELENIAFGGILIRLGEWIHFM